MIQYDVTIATVVSYIVLTMYPFLPVFSSANGGRGVPEEAGMQVQHKAEVRTLGSLYKHKEICRRRLQMQAM